MTFHVRDGKICFAEPMLPATIVRRPNRFVIDVEVEGAVVGCHCPTTGRIGNLVLDGLPCLLSPSQNTARKTPYTVEAISVDPPEVGDRLVKHIGELGRSLQAHERAVLLVCFLYDNPGFQVLHSAKHREVKAQVTTALQQGVEIWQVNFQLDSTGVRVIHHHELTQQFRT